MIVNFKNLFVFIFLFIAELLIVINFKDGFIRNNFGDYLAILMLYYLFRSFMKLKAINTALLTLFLVYFIEFLQFIHLTKILGIEKYTIVKIILGNTFSAHDIIAYTLGFLTILLIEKLKTSKLSHQIFQSI